MSHVLKQTLQLIVQTTITATTTHTSCKEIYFIAQEKLKRHYEELDEKYDHLEQILNHQAAQLYKVDFTSTFYFSDRSLTSNKRYA